MDSKPNQTMINVATLLRITLGIILAVLTYRGVMLCEAQGKLDIPYYPAVTLAVCAAGTFCALQGYFIFLEMFEDGSGRGGCLQNILTALALLYLIATAVPVFYASLDSMVPGAVFRGDTSYSGEITSVGKPEKYPQVIPFFPEVTRYDCEYKYSVGTEAHTGSFNTAIRYSVGDEIAVYVPGNAFVDEYVLESERSFTDPESCEIASLIFIYIVMLIFFIPFAPLRVRKYDQNGTADITLN